jgi:hypothetical protein
MSDKKFLYELMSPVDYMNLCNEVLGARKEGENGEVLYGEIEYTVEGTLYKVQGNHFPVQDVIDSASSKCKHCNSKGYTTVNISKEKLPDPSGYFVDEEDPDAPEGASKASPGCWRITTPCECAVNNVIKKHGGLFTIDTRCVFVDLTFTSEKVDVVDTPEISKIEIVR